MVRAVQPLANGVLGRLREIRYKIRDLAKPSVAARSLIFSRVQSA